MGLSHYMLWNFALWCRQVATTRSLGFRDFWGNHSFKEWKTPSTLSFFQFSELNALRPEPHFHTKPTTAYFLTCSVWGPLSRDPCIELGTLGHAMEVQGSSGVAAVREDGPSPFSSMLLRKLHNPVCDGSMSPSSARNSFWEPGWGPTCHWAGKEMFLYLKLIT